MPAWVLYHFYVEYFIFYFIGQTFFLLFLLKTLKINIISGLSTSQHFNNNYDGNFFNELQMGEMNEMLFEMGKEIYSVREMFFRYHNMVQPIQNEEMPGSHNVDQQKKKNNNNIIQYFYFFRSSIQRASNSRHSFIMLALRRILLI